MFEWGWVVVPAVLIALATVLDGRIGGPYFAFSQAIFGYAELVQTYSEVSIRRALIRKAAYPLLAGAVLGLLGRPLEDAVSAGILGMLLLLWPAVGQGMPVELTRRRNIVTLYLGLVLVSGSAAWIGWYIADLLGSFSAAVEFVRDQLFSLLFGAIFFAFSGLLVERSSQAVRRDQDD